MLEFDEETTLILDDCYQGSDITRRRQASFDALKPASGDTIVDIGCGNGMLTAELARAVGPSGKVTGVDPSADMRKSAVERCSEFNWVEIVEGSVENLLFDDNSADKAASVQVFEYLPDVSSALRETHRILKPGGKLAVGDMHFGTLVWYSDEPERMQRMMRAWDQHCEDIALPEKLPALFKENGFILEDVHSLTFLDLTLKPDGLAYMMMQLMPRYAVANDLVSEAEVDAWSKEQTELADQGRFFFSFTHYVVLGRKPD